MVLKWIAVFIYAVLVLLYCCTKVLWLPLHNLLEGLERRIDNIEHYLGADECRHNFIVDDAKWMRCTKCEAITGRGDDDSQTID